MWLAEDAPIRKQDLVLDKPFVNAAGMLGFAPDQRATPLLDQLGAFITNPISRRPRQVAGARSYLPYPGGFLLHTGLPNPGISTIIRQNKRRWAAAPLPIIVHLLAETPDTLAEMVRKLEGLENVLAIEIGLAPDCTPEQMEALSTAAAGELPVIISLGQEQLPILLPVAGQLNPAALHLTAPRGTLSGADGNLVSGRLYGPAILPLMLNAAREAVKSEIPVIVDGGVYEKSQTDAFLDAGVLAVGLGAVLWGIDQDL
jgi:dihydroorotate dehydrogenase